MTHLTKKRKKSYYLAPQSKRKKPCGKDVCPGMTGILISTNDQEKFCVPEAYNLLNEYADQLYGPELSPDGPSVEEDIASSLTQEVNRLRRSETRRFQAINTGTKHLIFVQCHLPVDPVQLVYHILSDLMKTKQCKSRYCQRMIPVSTVCRANSDDLRKHIPDLLAPHFYQSDVLKKFAVVYKARNNNDVDREEIIKTLASLATRNGDYPHTVDLKNPDLTIIVEIIKNNCCVSVVREFNELKRYNIHSIMGTFKGTPQSESKVTKMAHEIKASTVKSTKEITTDHGITLTTDDATCVSTDDGTCVSTDDGATVTSDNGTCVSTDDGATVTGDNGTCVNTDDGATVTTGDGTCVSTDDGATVTGGDETCVNSKSGITITSYDGTCNNAGDLTCVTTDYGTSSTDQEKDIT